jgi:hypothetical protein
MNAQDRAIAAHAKSLQQHSGYDVVIIRGPRKSSAIRAVLSSSVHNVYDEITGIPTKIQSSDWIFTKSEVIVGGKAIELLAGDIITATILGVSRTFEVFPIAKRPCVEPHDASGLMIVVHTQEQ